MLNQFRKPDIAPVMVTAPAWARADLMLREVCTHVIESEPVLPFFLSKRIKGAGPTWMQHRVFRRYWFDAFEYEEAEVRGSISALRPIRRKMLIDPKRRRRVNASYDTYEGVDLMDHIACGVCGGKFRRKTCDAPDKHRDFLRAEREKQAAELVAAEVLELASVDMTEENHDHEVIEEYREAVNA